jgi:hypothetical protein
MIGNESRWDDDAVMQQCDDVMNVSCCRMMRDGRVVSGCLQVSRSCPVADDRLRRPAVLTRTTHCWHAAHTGGDDARND